MIHQLWLFTKREVWPRRLELFTQSQFWIAVVFGYLFARFGEETVAGKAAVSTVVTAVLAFAAIGFGFAIAGLAVSLTIPDSEFASRLARQRMRVTGRDGLLGIRTRTRIWKQNREANPFSDLVFVFSSTAMAFWLAIALALAFVFAFGSGNEVLSPRASDLERGLAGVTVATCAWASMQFASALLSVSALGSLYVKFLRSTDSQSESSAMGSYESESTSTQTQS